MKSLKRVHIFQYLYVDLFAMGDSAVDKCQGFLQSRRFEILSLGLTGKNLTSK